MKMYSKSIRIWKSKINYILGNMSKRTLFEKKNNIQSKTKYYKVCDRYVIGKTQQINDKTGNKKYSWMSLVSVKIYIVMLNALSRFNNRDWFSSILYGYIYIYYTKEPQVVFFHFLQIELSLNNILMFSNTCHCHGL